jgi:hypothetical protein
MDRILPMGSSGTQESRGTGWRVKANRLPLGQKEQKRGILCFGGKEGTNRIFCEVPNTSRRAECDFGGRGVPPGAELDV